MQEAAVSYWCLPCADDAQRYSAFIEALAAAQGAPVFAPHMTLATLRHAEDDLSDVTAALKGLVLQPLETGGTEVFTTSLFVRFQASDALLAARSRMEALPGFRQGRAFDPHLSLCYGPSPDLTPLRPALHALLARPVRFDRLAAVDITLPVETYEDVAGWRVAKTYPV